MPRRLTRLARTARFVAVASPRFDVIVVGSGFGGAVTAARLAEAGMRVLILERGPWWGPAGEGRPDDERRPFPRGAWGFRKALRNVRLARGHRSREFVAQRDGLFEIHSFANLDVYAGSGVGGGSLIYTNIIAAPGAHFWRDFPPEVNRADMAPHIDRVRQMLRPSPLPALPDKNRAFEAAIAKAGLGKPVYPDLAIAFGADPATPETRTNAAGVTQHTCTYCGECILGCPTRAKTTLDLTYIPVALAKGAQISPLCEVTSFQEDASGYRVHFTDHRTGQASHADADRVVLAAGTLNTLRLLFQARDRDHTLPRISPRLGHQFSPNADMLGVALRTQTLADTASGPALNAYLEQHIDGRAYVLGEVGLPLAALPLPGFAKRALMSTALFIAMGEDRSSGELRFDGRAGLLTDTGRVMDPAIFTAMEATMAKVATEYTPWRAIQNAPSGRGGARLATVHPLGGAALGRDTADGVVSHTGELFGHPRFYVADGSLYPHAPGIPPSLTIAALAERQAALMALG